MNRYLVAATTTAILIIAAFSLVGPAEAATMPNYSTYTITGGIAYAQPSLFIEDEPGYIAYSPADGIYEFYLGRQASCAGAITDATGITIQDESRTYSTTTPLINLGSGNYSVDFESIDSILHGGGAMIQFNWSGGAIGDNCSGAHPWPQTTIIMAPGPSVAFNSPLNDTTQPDFSEWSVNVHNDITDTLSVNYGLSPTTLNYTDVFGSLAPPSLAVILEPENLPIVFAKSQLLWYPPLTYPITWYAQAELSGGSTTIYSPLISFSIDPTSTNTATSSFPVNPLGSGAGSVSLPPAVSCGAIDYICQLENWIAQNLGGIIANIITPSNASLQAFGSLGTNIQTKAPWGYLSEIGADLTNLTASGTPIVNNLDTGDLANLAPLIGSVDGDVALLVLFALALWLLNRIAKFEL
jgi:hypothetical protein